jgi:hypothetical protein
MTSHNNFSDSEKDKIIAEKTHLIRCLQKEIELKNSGCHSIILPSVFVSRICKILNDNNALQRPSAFVLRHNGHSVNAIESLI